MLFCFASFDAKSQKIKSNDLQLWSAFDLKYKIINDLSFLFSEEMRFDENIDQFNCNLIDLGFQYKFTSYLRASAVYRFKSKRDKTNESIYIVAATASFDIKNFAFSHRTRWENEPYKENEKENNLRNRFGVKYKIKNFPITPYTSAEVYYRFLYDTGDRFNRYKLRIGIEYEPIKKQKIELDYTYDSEFNMNKIDIKRIIGVTYSISI